MTVSNFRPASWYRLGRARGVGWAVFALGGEGAVLRPVEEAVAEAQAVLVGLDFALALAGQHAHTLLEPFEQPHLGVVALDDGLGTEALLEQADDVGLAALGGLAQGLQHQGFAVTVDDERRYAVRLGVEQPVGGRVLHHALAEADGGLDLAPEVVVVDGDVLAGDEPQGDLGVGAEPGLAAEASALIAEAHGVAGLDGFRGAARRG